MWSSMTPLVRNVVDGIIVGDKIVLAAVGLWAMEELGKICCWISPSSVLCNSCSLEHGMSCCNPVNSCLEKLLGLF